MFIQFFYTESIAHLSYMLIADNQAIVIDPKRDIQDYLVEANKRQLQIAAVFLTHAHADFVAGHIELSQKTGAPIYAHKDSPFDFDFLPVSDKFEMRLNHLKINGLETPGHSPYDVSFLITDTARGHAPISVFTGDTLFVNDVGRPDLFPGLQDELAKKMFNSLQKLKQLPDFVEVYPAHAAGTLCGKKLAEKRTSTIGYERRFNSLLQIDDVNIFKHELLSDLPIVPRHFQRCADINTKHIAPLLQLKSIEEINFEQFNKIKDKAYLIDLRPYTAWAQKHIHKSFGFDYEHIPLSQYAGWLLNPHRDIILLTDRKLDLDKLATQFRRVGLDQNLYLVNQATQLITKQNLPVNHVPLLHKNNFLELLNKREIIMLDIRQTGTNDMQYVNYKHIPLMSLENRLKELEKDKSYVLVCDYGISSAAAASIILHLSQNNICILAGGLQTLKTKVNENNDMER